MTSLSQCFIFRSLLPCGAEDRGVDCRDARGTETELRVARCGHHEGHRGRERRRERRETEIELAEEAKSIHRNRLKENTEVQKKKRELKETEETDRYSL